MIFWNGSEFCSASRGNKDNTGIADMLRSERDALAHLCGSLGKFGHAAVVGFSPSWRWGLHPKFDLVMSEIRAIFDSANVFTTDGELLTSLLLPYVKVDPSKTIETRCDWWHC